MVLRYLGLISFWIGRETHDKTWFARGAESKASMEKKARLASTWNFQNSECSFWLCVSDVKSTH